MSARYLRRALGACVVAASLSSLAVAPAGGASSAAAARTCRPPDYPGSGYFTSLSVSHTTCRTGRRLALAYYHCRIENGGKDGRCDRRVMRFRCSEVRNRIATEIDARVRCRRGERRVTHTYQQNL
jgi:hypothetical protein